MPDITLDVALQPSERATGAIGTVEASQWHGMKPEYVGEATACYYRADRVLCLWECYFEDQYQHGEPADDPNYPILWHGIEDLLPRQFPDARQLVTPADYQRLLAQLGYVQLNDRAFAKVRS